MKTNNFAEFMKKYSFYIGVGFLTILLVVIFRGKKLDQYIKEGSSGLASLFTQDLKPLIFTSEITNEDVFNFAMFNSLPVNKKENKLLFVDKNSEGKNSISIQTADYKEKTSNYQNFVKYLELNEKLKNQLDSLLSHYKAKLYSTILTNDKNTIAVNQNIPLIHGLLSADIMHFAKKANKVKAQKIYSEGTDVLDAIEIAKIDESVTNETEPQDYLLHNNDSVYTVTMSANIPEVKYTQGDYNSKWREEYNKSKVWATEERIHNIERNKELATQYAPKRDKRDVRIYLPDMHGIKGLEKEMSKLKNLQGLSKIFTFGAPGKDGKVPPINFQMNFDISKIDSLVSTTLDAVLQMLPKEEREKAKREYDSAMAKERSARGGMNYFKSDDFKKALKEKIQKKESKQISQ
ncbi:MAG: hypothetical protein C0412_18790 [Flavobacterium sp.]|nr:hypothetical protein [Flavobacterium sp.]